MHLHRVTPTWDIEPPSGGQFLGITSEDCQAKESPFWGESDWLVSVRFPRFGGGEKRQSDFEVLVTWEDVEKIVARFCETGRPEAIGV
jgi:hypothetical protein